MKKSITTISAALSLTALAVPAHAQEGTSQSEFESVNRMSGAARRGIGETYRIVGSRTCGKACGRAAARVGTRIFDVSREAANNGGQKLQEFGRRSRERVSDRFGRGR